jgi:hypothetical protein
LVRTTTRSRRFPTNRNKKTDRPWPLIVAHAIREPPAGLHHTNRETVPKPVTKSGKKLRRVAVTICICFKWFPGRVFWSSKRLRDFALWERESKNRPVG